MNGLEELLKTIKKQHIYIQTHNYPDQDALASAMGLQVILGYFDIDSTICYEGLVDKHNTLKMLELLDIKAYPIEYIKMSKNDEIIIVDGQQDNINMKRFVGKCIACIDHHKLQDTTAYDFYDIRSDVGACSSIITYYFYENHLPIPKSLATGLLYGIKMDTSNLTRGVSDLDIDMFYYLYKLADVSTIRRIESSSIGKKDLQSYLFGIKDFRLYGNVGVANVGNDCSESMLGTVADFLITLTEVDFTLVYSYRAGGLKLSVRSLLEEVDASEVMKVALLRIGDGGGHNTMAAGFIPGLDNEETAMKVAQLVEQRVIKLVGEYTKVVE